MMKKYRIPRFKLGLPEKIFIKYRYCDYLSFSGTNDAYVYRCNSLYDPDYTGGGHQPRNFDQMSSIYAKYSVNAFKFKIIATFIPNGTEAEAANCIFYVQYMPIDLINAPTSENDI